MGPKNSETEKAISKGYRLKPETHKLIMKLSKKIKGTNDDTISWACNILYDIISKNGQKK